MLAVPFISGVYTGFARLSLFLRSSSLSLLFAHILRDPVRKDAVLDISCSGAWKMFSGPNPKNIDCTRAFLTGTGAGRFPLPVRRDRRSYFLLYTEKEKIFLAEEHLPMEGGFNFRDLGGIPGVGGRQIVWGHFIRADEMNRLTPEDLSYLSSIPVTTVVDFRTKEEIAVSKDRLPSSVQNVLPLAIDPGRLDPETLRKLQEAVTVEEMLLTMYRNMMRNEEVIAQYRQFFRVVQDTEKTPVLYHCTAGKDRTGMATVLLLSALGVARPLILKNYLDSNRYLRTKYARLMQKRPQLTALLTVRPEYLFLALDSIEEDFLSVESFLVKVMGVDIALIREKYLY